MADPDSMHSSCTSTSCKQCNTKPINTEQSVSTVYNNGDQSLLTNDSHGSMGNDNTMLKLPHVGNPLNRFNIVIYLIKVSLLKNLS